MSYRLMNIFIIYALISADVHIQVFYLFWINILDKNAQILYETFY